MSLWIDFVYSNFLSDYDLETQDNGLSKVVFVKSLKSDLYIKFDISNGNCLQKLEVGSLNQEVYSKCIFTSNASFNVEFRMNSWFEEGEQSNLEFSEETHRGVLNFLKLVLEDGWKEEQFLYKGSIYKVIVYLKINNNEFNYKVPVESMAEQDIPLPFDKLFRKLSTKYIEIRGKGISSRTFKIGQH